MTEPGADISVEEPTEKLWDTDTGVLRDQTRRALLRLVQGPYLSSERHSALWSALLADERVVRSRLADLYLKLIIDYDAEVAFAQNVTTSDAAPSVMRTAQLTFIDTVMLLYLRQQLLHDAGQGRTIISREETVDQLATFRGKDGSDPAGFAKRLDSSWNKMKKYGILHPTTTEDRFEISPVLRLLFGPEEVRAVRAEYDRLISPDEGTHGSDEELS